MEIRAAIAYSDEHPFEIETCELRAPGPQEVLVRIRACGICHTDLAVKHQKIRAPLPRILGHEGAGIVERIGASVEGLVVGDHVLMSFGSCGDCTSCNSGAPSYCDHSFSINFLGQRNRPPTHRFRGEEIAAGFFSQSAFATHAIATTQNIIKIDHDLPLALMAPLGCGIQTGMGAILRALKPGIGDGVAIFGCGAVGLAAIIAAKISHCTPIIAIDVNRARLDLAKQFGASHTIDASSQDVLAAIRSISPRGVNYTFETSGVPEIAELALEVLMPRGTAGFVAPSKTGNYTFKSGSLVVPGKTLRGIVQGDAVPQEFIPSMIEYFRRGDLPLEKLVTTFAFEDINKAVMELESGNVLKAVLLM